jgi:DEAD/DEAH box helicase domain-containing protein
VHLPEIQMHTTSYWITLPERLLAQLSAPRALLVDALRGLGHALETVASLLLMCDPRDIHQCLGDGEQETDGSRLAQPAGREPRAVASAPASARIGQLDPTLFLFDAQPGGVGLAERIFERSAELMARARALIAGCPCEGGCPACVGPAEDSVRKQLALELVDQLLLPDEKRAAPSVERAASE